MKRMILGFMLTSCLVISWSIVNAEDGFYVIPVKKNNYAPVEKTGQTKCYDGSGVEIQCAGTGQDGEYQKGVTWPNPRLVDNDNGTVTDNLTGLIWLKNANCTIFFSGDITGQNNRSWPAALTAANSLASGNCGLTDDSSAGNWRLPNLRELYSLIDFGEYNPAMQNGHPFISVQSDYYWSSTTNSANTDAAWDVHMFHGHVGINSKNTNLYYVWPVRGGN